MRRLVLVRTFILIFVLAAAGGVRAEPAAVEGSLPDQSAPPVAAVEGTLASGAAAEGEALAALGQIEEIVVTARRREEFLEDTPIAVTALSAANLENSNITSINEIQELVPNLSIASGGANQSAQISIRGVGASGPGVAFDPGVGLYIDGVFLPRAQAAIFDVIDIESVQVLRGPQGTLFGKNTVGGAISVSTVKPREELGALFSVRPGNLGAIRTRLTLDMPVRIGWFDDKLFTRISFASRNRRGYTWNSTHDEYWGEENGVSFIGAIRFLPVQDVTIDISGSWYKDQVHNSLGQCVEIVPAGLGSAFPGYWDACNSTSPREILADANQISASSSWGTWGTIAWDAGALGPIENIVAKSITSWRRQLSPGILDADATQFEVIRVANFGGGGVDGEAGQAQQIQQELQLAGSAWEERINLVAGAFFFWETADRTNGLTVPVVNQFTSNRIMTDNFTWAAFAQATVDPREWISLTAGLRYTEDTKRARQINRNYNLPPGEDVMVDVSGKGKFASWTPMASVALFLPEPWLAPAGLDHLMGYFTYSKGFKGGGLNAVLAGDASDGLVPFDPEILENFEIGTKAIAFENRLTFNLSLFTGLYDDIQRTQFESIVDEEGELETRNLTINAAKASIRGVELELQAVPIEGLRLTGLIGYLDARYDSFPNAIDQRGGATPVNRAGQRFTGSPTYNTFVTIQYSMPIEVGGWLDGYLTPRLEWAYRAEEMFAEPEVPQGRQGGYSLLNARLSYDFFGNQAQVALWARNLTDETYVNVAVPLVGPMGILVQGYGPPRLWGAELTYQF